MGMAWFVALNLRAAPISVSPILPLIRSDLGLSYAQAGFLFALPILMMGVFGLVGGRLADTVGIKGTISLGLAAILVGGALRTLASGYLLLAIWTMMLGAGIGIASPGLTRMVKDRFSDLPGTATGIYTNGLAVGAIIGPWLTVPYLLEWSGAWRDPTVWKLNLILLSQNLVFYSLAAWIPTYCRDLGFTLERGTLVLTVFLLASLPGSLLLPYFSDRMGGRRSNIIGAGAVLLVTLIGFAFYPLAVPWVYMLVFGVSIGGLLGLIFALPLDYVRAERVGSVAGANFLVGYGGAFLGPLVMGWIHDVTASFTAGWIVLVPVVSALIGLAASLPRKPA
jgi:CP family cyanate transporter-like MFS transporter